MRIRKFAAVTLNQVFKNQTYTVRHGLAKGLRRRGGLAFLPAAFASTPERVEEESFLLSLSLEGQTIYDVGGDQGIYTVFFARKVGDNGRVITFEPNPESYRRIVANAELNQFRNVDVRPIGLGPQKGKLTFVFPEGEPARGSADATLRPVADMETQGIVAYLTKPLKKDVFLKALEQHAPRFRTVAKLT